MRLKRTPVNDDDISLNMGLQLTTSEDEAIRNKKLSELEKVRSGLNDTNITDTVLVPLPREVEYVKLFNRWLSAGSPPGGPTKFLTKEETLAILRPLWGTIYNEQEVEDMINLVGFEFESGDN